ncbi:putative bifunctional diguanylate cyclase/phosphodiesterase [Terriglobus saanensis]|uniref:Response regulator receiver modulated diguanylate cyclase/phosphodiesterase with PAS/PAC sensor(S) n=1 Tax=Terriglobus saanensis (strain ATCC BAA-1853 / DSM 23119 / SP1PR4) TaxID=401053 RepID=E8V7W4_TERSS|nr:EAL domain-containing protein [Terriglobus saanensis]ADV82888.1 response regulator receiver modulated diguanylate cyclase/phosphodiesterase with PAS/PAC sensor(s) [Terriglobus saanensis SP1PR4]
MNKKPIKALLVVEDNAGDARLLLEMLNEGPHTIDVTVVSSLRDAELHLVLHTYDIALLDLGLPDGNGMEVVRRARSAAPSLPLVVLTGLDDEAMAAQTLKEGAQDYLIKGEIEGRGLLRALRYAVERKAMEESLFTEKERAQVTLNCIADGVVCTDSSGNITFLNVVAERMTGWSLEEASGRPMSEVYRIFDATTGIATNLANPLAFGNDGIYDKPNSALQRRDGIMTPIENSISPILDRLGCTTGAVMVSRDVSAARRMAIEMIHSAEHDFLTGLPNRMLLHDRVSQAIALAIRQQHKVALLFIDVDGFKHINDSLGHPAGDKLLQSLAHRLVGCVRSSDTVSRQGGDEFVVLLSSVRLAEDTAVAAKKLLAAIADPHLVDRRDLHVTASIGVSVYPDDGTDAETLIKNADTAMYQAKAHGRQGYQFFKAVMNVKAVERQSTEESLRSALKRQEFHVHYQPRVDLRTGQIIGAEALLRWSHPERGNIPPDQFIPIAEDCGLILPIGEWILREACAQTQKWLQEGLPPITIAVNISGVQFGNEDFLADVFAILEETGLDPRHLELELTESVLMKHAESTEVILKTLRSKGIQVSVDDFGTGYSSLSYLSKFSLDALKIDQSFVRRIISSPEDTAIVTAIISMGRSLSLQVVAEGVETLEELAFLQAHQCDEAQGYFFGRPSPPKNLQICLQFHAE